MSRRGPYLSSTEARRRLLDTGADIARDLPATDAFVHLRAVDLAERAGMSKSGIYRHFANIDELHTAAIVEVAHQASDAQGELLGEDIVEIVAEGTEGDQLVHNLARLSFTAGLADDAVDMTVLLAALADHPDIAEAGLEVDRAARETMQQVYRAVEERIHIHLRDNATHEDLAVMAFALSDALVMWHNVDPEAVPTEIDGPEGIELDGPWDPFALGLWACYEHLKAKPRPETETDD